MLSSCGSCGVGSGGGGNFLQIFAWCHFESLSRIPKMFSKSWNFVLCSNFIWTFLVAGSWYFQKLMFFCIILTHIKSGSFAEDRNMWDNVYGAVVMTHVILQIHPVHLMNVEQCQAAADPQTTPTDLGSEFAWRLLLSTSTITIYYYSARKLILILPSHSA